MAILQLKSIFRKINKNQVKIAFDLGLNSGLNVIAYNKLLPNLEKHMVLKLYMIMQNANG